VKPAPFGYRDCNIKDSGSFDSARSRGYGFDYGFGLDAGGRLDDIRRVKTDYRLFERGYAWG
jgi:hypothetical protein